MQKRGSVSKGENRTVRPTSEGAAAVTEKERLLREVQELRCIIKQCEWSLQTVRFKDVKQRVTDRVLRDLVAPPRLGRMPNVDVDLQSDLYRFAGFRCIKFQRNELVFSFTSTNGEQRDNAHAVQIFVKDGKGNLGKWVMPMSIDMNDILSETPIDQLKNVTAFIKNCKHNADCYAVRREQFLSLKESTSRMKHCTLQSDMGFKQLSLELCGVHDIESDSYINVIIYLLYHSDKARPHKIDVDSTNGRKLSDDTRQRLKACLKEFKISDLQTAFDKVLEDNSTFTWVQTEDSESPLELNDTSISDEESFLTKLQSDRKRASRRLKRKSELQKKWNKRKRQKNVANIKSSEDDQEDSRSRAEVSRAESQRRVPMRGKETKKATFISKRRKSNKTLLEEATPVHKSKVLKQTKLNFQAREATNSNANESFFESKLCSRPDGPSKRPMTAEVFATSGKPFTSTPLRVNLTRLPLSPNLENNDLTSIETTKKTANKLGNSKNGRPGNKQTPERSDRSLPHSAKTTRLSSRISRTKRLTRSMISN
ncbi:PREDICTED: uncharacterized protein LOC105561296 [Vollenhovia emeryi]|uniref:uncharacterized protein LOC105561296 n=1 Tax=Vollenhovia emeryi TaxID=411798 RepID=UPI0005F4C397|nr:PREDICTED: uncharacterized protein LOC105561296 [Vollenhovia emeryi]